MTGFALFAVTADGGRLVLKPLLDSNFQKKIVKSREWEVTGQINNAQNTGHAEYYEMYIFLNCITYKFWTFWLRGVVQTT